MRRPRGQRQSGLLRASPQRTTHCSTGVTESLPAARNHRGVANTSTQYGSPFALRATAAPISLKPRSRMLARWPLELIQEFTAACELAWFQATFSAALLYM